MACAAPWHRASTGMNVLTNSTTGNLRIIQQLCFQQLKACMQMRKHTHCLLLCAVGAWGVVGFVMHKTWV
jgi:hypothetical protein